MEENAIRETIEIEDELEAGNKCECLIDASSGALLEIKAPAFWVWTLRLPDSVRRISKEFKTCFVRPGSDRARPARIRELVIPAGMEEIEPDALQWIDKITIEQDSPKYRMAGSALIEVAPDGSGKVVKYNGNIPTDGWITTLGKNSRGARLRPDIHGNKREQSRQSHPRLVRRGRQS